MGPERRNLVRRGALVQRVITGITQTPDLILTVAAVQQWLDVPQEAAERILERLASSGLLEEVQKGVWARNDRFWFPPRQPPSVS